MKRVFVPEAALRYRHSNDSSMAVDAFAPFLRYLVLASGDDERSDQVLDLVCLVGLPCVRAIDSEDHVGVQVRVVLPCSVAPIDGNYHFTLFMQIGDDARIETGTRANDRGNSHSLSPNVSL